MVPPEERVDASLENGWFTRLKNATPERNKLYPAEIITIDDKKITGTVSWTDSSRFRSWDPREMSFIDLPKGGETIALAAFVDVSS